MIGDDILDLIEESGEVDPDNGEVDAEIAIQFPRAPHATPLAGSPPPPPMMAEDGPPAVRGKGTVKETVEYERVAASVGDCGKLKYIFR